MRRNTRRSIALAPTQVGDGWVLSMAFSVTGGTTEPLEVAE